MKKYAIILGFLGLISIIFATTMIVHTTNGDQEFNLNDITSITFIENAGEILFQDNFEANNVNEAPIGWTFFQNWGDTGQIRIVDEPVYEGNLALRVKGQYGWCQGIYKEGTVFQEDTKVSFYFRTPTGTSTGYSPGSFLYAGIQIAFIATADNVFEAKMYSTDNQDEYVTIQNLSPDNWYKFSLEIDWDNSKCRLVQGSNSTEILSFTENINGGWASDVTLYGNNNNDCTNIIYIDDIKIEEANYNFR